MENRPKLYATFAFVAGVLVCLGFKDLYPDLERRYKRRYGVRKALTRSSPALDDQIHLEDHETLDHQAAKASDVPVGIEACIGNTPLFKIKSLSEATGCEILGKAEVCQSLFRSYAAPVLSDLLQFLNGGGGSPKDRVALSMINTVHDSSPIQYIR